MDIKTSGLTIIDATPEWGSSPLVLHELGVGSERIIAMTKDDFKWSLYQSAYTGSARRISHGLNTDEGINELRRRDQGIFVMISPTLYKKRNGERASALISSLMHPLIRHKVQGFICIFTGGVGSSTHSNMINVCKHVSESLGLDYSIVNYPRDGGQVPLTRGRAAFVASTGGMQSLDINFLSSPMGVMSCFQGLPLKPSQVSQMPVNTDAITDPYTVALNRGARYTDGCMVPRTGKRNIEIYSTVIPGTKHKPEGVDRRMVVNRLGINQSYVNSRDPAKVHLVHPLENRQLTLREVARLAGMFDEMGVDKIQAMHNRRDYALFYLSNAFPQAYMINLLGSVRFN